MMVFDPAQSRNIVPFAFTHRVTALNALNGLSREQARGEMCACRVPVEPRVSIPQHDARGVERGRDTERDARDG
jgi:hypothetical protein